MNEENYLSVCLGKYYWEAPAYSSYNLSLITVMVCIMLLKKSTLISENIELALTLSVLSQYVAF